MSPRAWTFSFALFTAVAGLPAPIQAEGNLPPIRPLRTSGLAADAAAIILSGQQGGDLPLAALAAPRPRPEGGLIIPVSIEIDAGVLFDFDTKSSASPDGEEEEPRAERLEIIAYVLGEDGASIQDSLLQAYAIDAHRLEDSRRGLRFVAELEMPRPPGTARVLARLQQREALGVLSLPIEGETPSLEIASTGTATTADAAPTPHQEAVRLTPPLMPGGEGWLHLPWILPNGVLPPLPSPFDVQAVASKAVVTRGKALEFKLLARGLESVDSQLSLDFSAPDGRLSAQVTGTVKSYSTPSGDGQREILVTGETADLPLGIYSLTALIGAGGEQHRTPPLAVLILDDLDLGDDQAKKESMPDSWPWQFAKLTAPQAPTLASGRTNNSAAVNRGQLTSGLDEIYAHLTAGEDTVARRRHVRLALAIAKDHGSLGLKAMGKEEFDRAKMMAEVSEREIENGTGAQARYSADSVLPLVLLNLELYRETRRLGRTLISTHARFMVLRLIELYLSASSNPTQARKTAASLFVSLGGELQLADMVYFSERMFRKALTFDPEQPTALLALGMNYHLIGDLQRARDSFSSLLAIEPGHVEGNLRLAHLELMEGKKKRARRLLQKAVQGDGPEWALSVAYQELARLDIDDGELKSAQKTLERAIAQLPDQPRLLILLAFAHDAAAANEKARAVLSQARVENTGRPSARRRFGDWSRESFVRNDRQVQERVHRAVPVLAERWQLKKGRIQ